MAAIETLFKITASVAGANAITSLAQEIAKVSTEGENLSRKFQKIGTALKLFAVGEGVSMFKEWIGSAIETGVQLDHISQKTGVSVEALGHLKGAAQAGGVGLEDLGNALAKFDKAIISAQDGTGKQAKAFAALGINVKDANGNIKPTEELFLEISDRFHDTADGAGKTAVAIELLGKAGANMIPTLNMGREEILALGLAVGPEFTEQAHENELAMLKIKTQFEQASITIAGQLLPGLTSIEKGFANNNLAVDILVGSIKVLETAFVGLEQVGSAITAGLGTVFALLITRLETLGAVAKDVATFDYTKASADAKAGGEMMDAIRAEALAKAKKDNLDYRAQIDAIWNAPAPAAKKDEKKEDQIKFDPGNAVKAAAEAEKVAKELDKWVTNQNEVNTSLAQEADYIGKTSIEIEILKANRKLDAEFAEKSIGLTQDQKEAFKEEEEQVKSSRDAILQHNYELSRMASTGATEYLKKFAETATDSAAQMKTVLGNAFNGLTDVFTNFITTGKLSFSSLVDSILKDLARITVERSITGPLSTALGSVFSAGGFGGSLAGAFGFANGGIMGSGGSLPLNAYAGGGVANSPQLAVFGEGRLNEAYVPLPDGRSIPVNLKGAGGGATTVNVVVNMAGNNSTDSTQGMDAKGQQLGRTIAAAVKATLIDEKRPGGLLAA